MGVIGRIADEQLPNRLADESVMTTEAFVRQAEAADAPYRFATSRSGKSSPYAGTERIASNCADAEALLGITPDDRLLNLLAPRPHLSAFAARAGARQLGASILTDSFDDLDAAIGDPAAASATAVLSIPSKASELADEMADRHGHPAEVFPNLELGLVGGELVRPDLRERLRETWGVAAVREFYGSSEAGLVAAGVDETRRLVPLLNHYVLELEVRGELLDIREIDSPTVGSLLITDPNREAIELVRYRQGDAVRVHPGEPLPRIEPLGRADDAISLAGAIVHPGDLYRAIATACGPAVEPAAIYDQTMSPPRLEVIVAGSDDDRRGAIHEQIRQEIPGLEHALTGTAAERLRIRQVNDLEVVDPETARTEQIVVLTR